MTALGLDRPFDSHGQPIAAGKPLPTTLDLYRELKAATPESSQWLLHDLFEKNTFWALEGREASAEQTAFGEWQLTMTVRARKFVMDTQGVETEVPMDDWIEIGVYALEEEMARTCRSSCTSIASHGRADAHADGAEKAAPRWHRPSLPDDGLECGGQRQGGEERALIRHIAIEKRLASIGGRHWRAI